MNHETTRTLAIIHELTRHGWTRDKGGERWGSPLCWRDPVHKGLYDQWGALRIVREREGESEVNTNG